MKTVYKFASGEEAKESFAKIQSIVDAMKTAPHGGALLVLETHPLDEGVVAGLQNLCLCVEVRGCVDGARYHYLITEN